MTPQNQGPASCDTYRWYTKRRSLLMAGDDEKMFMTGSLSITPNTTEHHLIDSSDNSVAYRPYSIILASCKLGCKPGFRPGLQPGFRQVRAGLRHAFDLFYRKPGREPDASISTCRK